MKEISTHDTDAPPPPTGPTPLPPHLAQRLIYPHCFVGLLLSLLSHVTAVTFLFFCAMIHYSCSPRAPLLLLFNKYSRIDVIFVAIGTLLLALPSLCLPPPPSLSCVLSLSMRTIMQSTMATTPPTKNPDDTQTDPDRQTQNHLVEGGIGAVFFT